MTGGIAMDDIKELTDAEILSFFSDKPSEVKVEDVVPLSGEQIAKLVN